MGECGQLGYYSNLAPGRGSLYLLTRDEEPFCGKKDTAIVCADINIGVVNMPWKGNNMDLNRDRNEGTRIETGTGNKDRYKNRGQEQRHKQGTWTET